MHKLKNINKKKLIQNNKLQKQAIKYKKKKKWVMI